MFYRIQQFYHSLFPQISSADILLVHSFLSGTAVSLFEAQSLADQRHALDVARDLLQNQIHLPFSQKDVLIQAALLHDCGKIRYPLRIWQRIYIVLCAKLPLKLQESLKTLPYFEALSLPLTLAEEHPEWGAELATQEGLSENVIQLIRHHHTPRSEAGKLLHSADNRH